MTSQTMSGALLAAEEPQPLAVHPSEVILCIVVFLILVFMVKKYVVPNFEKAYAERTAAIEGGMAEAKQAQEEAKEALDRYNSQLAEARHEAARIREEAREQGAQIVAEMREQAQSEAERITSTAHLQIEAERAQVLQQLRGEVGGLATTLAGHIVGESLEDDERQKRVVDRFIEGLEASPTGGRSR